MSKRRSDSEHAFKRFCTKILIDDESGCWEWQNAKDDDGYGQFWYNGGRVLAHRFIVEYMSGARIPQGMEVDHECVNTSCVNPHHLQVVTKLKNLQLKGWRRAALAGRRSSGQKRQRVRAVSRV